MLIYYDLLPYFKVQARAVLYIKRGGEDYKCLSVFTILPEENHLVFIIKTRALQKGGEGRIHLP